MSDIIGNDWHEDLGTSVAMSEKCGFVAVGSPFANDRQGKVSLYRIAGAEDANPDGMGSNSNSTSTGGVGSGGVGGGYDCGEGGGKPNN